MPGADESYRYCEVGLSQQVCTISSETSSRLNCRNVEGAYSNLPCTIVMEEGCQKSKRLSYTAKFKREVIRCTEKGNRKVAGLFVSYDLLREKAMKARSLNIPQSCFKASKGWAIRFMRRMGMALQHRTTICQKLPKDFEQKLLNYQQYIIFPKSSSRPRI
jgi:hypothetical protein